MMQPQLFGPQVRREPIRRLDLPIIEHREASWSRTRGELMTGGAVGPHELEILQPSHVILMRFEGTSPGYEWSDGSARRKVPILAPGTILFSPAHRYAWVGKKAQTHGRFLALTIDPSELARLDDDEFDSAQVEFLPQSDLNDEGVRRVLFAIKDEIERPGPAGQLYRETLTLELLVHLVRSASNLARAPHPVCAKGGLPGWRLRRALELLEADLTEAPSLDQLARHVGLSPTHFCRAFKRSVGVAPHRYLIERRISRAKELMADRRRSLTEIALNCGFGSSSQFSTMFKRTVGIPPSVYRRQELPYEFPVCFQHEMRVRTNPTGAPAI